MLEIKAWSMPPHPPPPQAECLSFEWDEKQAYMHQCQHDPRTNTPTAMENLYLWQNSVSIWKTCIWQNSAEITPVVLIDRKLRNRKKHTRWHCTNERKWQQPQFQLHLNTKSCSRWKLGLLTSFAAAHLWKMMLCTLFWSIQAFQWIAYLLNISTLCVCARIDFF